MNINGFSSYLPYSNNYPQDTFYINISNESYVNLNGCSFDDLDISNGSNTYALSIYGNARVISNFSKLPSGGKNTLIQDTCVLQTNDGFDIKRQTSSGTQIVQFN
jgi:hypothetical protein